jgi:hypothetical protein
MKVKITVKEFLEEGGKLKKGTELFWAQAEWKKIGKFAKIDEKGLFWISNLDKQIHPINKNVVVLEAEVKLITK